MYILVIFLVILIQFRELQREYTENYNFFSQKLNMIELAEVNKLASALKTLSYDENIKNVYLKNDRDELYNITFPLLKSLKDNFNITHLYFINKEGTCFLRVH